MAETEETHQAQQAQQTHPDTRSAETHQARPNETNAANTANGISGAWRAAATRHALLPLRVFLGITFAYAGLDKLTSPTFFAGGPGSLLATLHAVRGTAAVPALIDLALRSPNGFGYAIAFGELAVGLGALFGLLTRIAALGGALISLSLWLTVSWATTPYYYGNDLVYLMAWVPLVLAGGPQFSLDRLIAARRGH